jgi:ribosomal protein S27AE
VNRRVPTYVRKNTALARRPRFTPVHRFTERAGIVHTWDRRGNWRCPRCGAGVQAYTKEELVRGTCWSCWAEQFPTPERRETELAARDRNRQKLLEGCRPAARRARQDQGAPCGGLAKKD